MGKMLTVKQVADELGLSTRSVYIYINSGKIKAVKIGRGLRIDEDEVNRIKEQGFTPIPQTAKAAAEVTDESEGKQ